MRLATHRGWLLWYALALGACDNDTSPRRDRGNPTGDAGAQVESDAGGAGPARPSDAGSDASAAAGDASSNPTDAVPDAALRCGTGECDLLDRDSCGPGAGCVFALPDASAEQLEPRCMPVGRGEDGAACSTREDCAAGLDCSARAGVGECRAYCCTWNSALGCPAGQFCRTALADARGELTDVFLCDACDDCDVRDPKACAANQGCYLLPGLGSCRACLAAGERVPGEICSFGNDCLPGSSCVRTADGEQHCVEFCNLTTGSGCAEGTSCRRADGSELPPATGLCL